MEEGPTVTKYRRFIVEQREKTINIILLLYVKVSRALTTIHGHGPWLMCEVALSMSVRVTMISLYRFMIFVSATYTIGGIVTLDV